MNDKKPWIICVFIDSPKETTQALHDLHRQSVSPGVLAIDNGSSLDSWTQVRTWAKNHDRIRLWRHNPSMPSLAMTWNYALDHIWGLGAEEAMVVNHDVRVHRLTYDLLSTARAGEDALFVSAVGVTPEQFESTHQFGGLSGIDLATMHGLRAVGKGGPDFSCFLISKACHEKYRFDENFIPAYCEDLDYHRRMLLGGDGKKIFSINVPFAHTASGVLKSKTPEKRAELEERISKGSRAYYQKKWGGPPNGETYWSEFGKYSSPLIGYDDKMDPTTPNLQRYYGLSGGSS